MKEGHYTQRGPVTRPTLKGMVFGWQHFTCIILKQGSLETFMTAWPSTLHLWDMTPHCVPEFIPQGGF